MSTSELTMLRCGCGAKLRAPVSAAGKRFKCPKCGTAVTVPAAAPVAVATTSAAPPPPPPAPAPVAAPEPLGLSDPDDEALYSLKDEPIQPAPLPQRAPSIPAPPPVSNRPGPVAPPPQMYRGPIVRPEAAATAEPTGSMLKGLGLSIAFAFVGALVWYGLAALTEREFGLVAWGVGLAAGAGMAAGFKGHSVVAGLLASMTAVGGIVTGKVMIFLFVVLPALSPMLDAGPDAPLVMALTEQVLLSQGVDPDEASDREFEQAISAAAERVSAMTDTERAEVMAELQIEASTVPAGAVGVAKVILFFVSMFGIFDLLFVVLAIASAFKLATFAGQ